MNIHTAAGRELLFGDWIMHDLHCDNGVDSCSCESQQLVANIEAEAEAAAANGDQITSGTAARDLLFSDVALHDLHCNNGVDECDCPINELVAAVELEAMSQEAGS